MAEKIAEFLNSISIADLRNDIKSFDNETHGELGEFCASPAD